MEEQKLPPCQGAPVPRFSYIKYDEAAMQTQQAFKAEFEKLEARVNGLANGRAKSLVYTHLEEAYMWVGKSIRDDQVAREGKCQEQKERGAE